MLNKNLTHSKLPVNFKKTATITILVAFLFYCLASAASVPLKAESWPVPEKLPSYPVTRVIDGDTIEVERLGKIRYIGINTPEIHHPVKGVEPYSHEAFLVNRRLVEGKKVGLELDLQRRDKYGRALAYVYSGSVFVNAYLVEAGYAQLMTIPPNVKYAHLFLQLQREAQQAKRGLWGKVKPPKTAGRYLGSIKGHTYHYPGCKWAKMIKPENRIWFDSGEEAEKAGYRPCRTCKP